MSCICCSWCRQCCWVRFFWEMKAVRLLLRLTCYKLREQLVVAVDDIDRHVPGRLQEQRAALPRDGRGFSFCSWCNGYWTVNVFIMMIKRKNVHKAYTRTITSMCYKPSLLICLRWRKKQHSYGSRKIMVMASERKSFVVSTTKVEKEQFWLSKTLLMFTMSSLLRCKLGLPFHTNMLCTTLKYNKIF